MPDQDNPLPTSRSLTCLTGNKRQNSAHGRMSNGKAFRPLTGFVAQLLAVKHDVPEFRTRRQLDPAQAAGLYGSQAFLAADQPIGRLNRAA